MANTVDIKRLSSKVFKFIEKIETIEKFYNEKWREVQQVIVLVKQNKRQVLESQNILEGDGTETAPAWENIYALNSFVQNNYYPADMYLTKLYYDLEEKKIEEIPSLKEIIYKVLPDFHGKVEEIPDIYKAMIDKEKKLYPNQLIHKNIPLIYRFITIDSNKYINQCAESLFSIKNFLVKIVSKEEEYLDENSSFMNDLINEYYTKSSFFFNEDEEAIEKATTKTMFDENILNIILYKTQLTSVFFRSLLTTFSQALSILNRIIEIDIPDIASTGEENTEDESNETEPTVSEPPQMEENEPLSSEDEEEEKVNTDVTETDSSDENF